MYFLDNNTEKKNTSRKFLKQLKRGVGVRVKMIIYYYKWQPASGRM